VKDFERFFSSFRVPHLPPGNISPKKSLERLGEEVSRDNLEKLIQNSWQIISPTNTQLIGMEMESNPMKPEGSHDPQIEDEDLKDNTDK